jgi:hypothetical protein
MKSLLRITVAVLLVIGCGDGPVGTADLDTQVREALSQANILSPDPAAADLGATIPASVPSGLPVGD